MGSVHTTRPVRRLASNALFRLQDVCGHFRLHRWLPPGSDVLAGLMYHGLETEPARLAADKLNITPLACRREIEYYQRQGYQLVSAGRIGPLEGQGPTNSRIRARLFLSFDDAYLGSFPHLLRWLRDERWPILLAICPNIVEERGIFWRDELMARFSLMRQEMLEIENGGIVHRYGRGDGELAKKQCSIMPRAQAQQFLDAIRSATRYRTDDQIRRSPCVHATMGWPEIKDLVATGHCTIAAHSLDHFAATSLSTDEFRADAAECKRRIESALDVPCEDYVYPFGSATCHLSDETDGVLAACGYRRSYTSVSKLNRGDVAWQIGRFLGTGYGGSLAYYRHLWALRHVGEEGLGGAVGSGSRQ